MLSQTILSFLFLLLPFASAIIVQTDLINGHYKPSVGPWCWKTSITGSVSPECTKRWSWCLLRAVGDQCHSVGPKDKGGGFPPWGLDSQPGRLWLLSACPCWGGCLGRAGVDLERSNQDVQPWSLPDGFKCKFDWAKHNPDLKSSRGRTDHRDPDLEVHSGWSWGAFQQTLFRHTSFILQKTYVASKANKGTGKTVVWNSFDPRVNGLGEPFSETLPYNYVPLVYYLGWKYPNMFLWYISWAENIKFVDELESPCKAFSPFFLFSHLLLQIHDTIWLNNTKTQQRGP